ncbi:NUDIX hydrolase [Salinarimonas soli]|uniref:NUDIX hydrolase n=1 Tax=Salinarimonas soli TaxID=1638099 RepID=A0A5B2VBD7_9HYPH|nr:NUDIX hydrolase [Salinarimonas soli]KAA2235732.1 NUDIX hydrolase [Salinarimonas soli]
MDTILKPSPVTRTQYAALPYRRDADGGLRLLLVTSRETRRWVIPKGWPMRGVKPHGVAAREAYEEAGVEGGIGRRGIGFYYYHKRLKDGSTVPVCVEVFPLEVSRQHERWPERGQRTSRWATPEEAAGLVEEESLSGLIRAFGEIFGPGA